ncbi:Bifunctional monodehydroascorbate reductase and carbonic anhydrase nectarin-3 [Morella rubra]|uniref:Bifunctional monodehydroascorbate reductase and carbonic anhydrase nectarin-3 n=1 Tax=Morella rubra TaxID=262757 RepID=A0A6A1UHR4_9ROSI|nr:Bifunctional monodehydroascorbate reductase and carbonic anhydrase nectarin-3 [Morella rubra]
MRNPSKLLFVSSLFIVGVVFSNFTATIAQEVEDEREFDYIEGSKKGPSHWGEIQKDWATCKNGTMQSPIDLSSRRVKMIPQLGELEINYKPCNSTVKNRGHDILLQWEDDAGSIRINGTDYFLEQGHWHSPSEHSINGRRHSFYLLSLFLFEKSERINYSACTYFKKRVSRGRYDLELHMVHVTEDPSVKNKIAVIGLFYKIGQPDAFLSKLMRNIASMAEIKAERNMGVIDPREIKMGCKKYYRYLGSLTVPPCTEGVIWTISRKIRTVSRGQVKLLRDVVHDYAERNARPVQSHNNREVQFYGPNSRDPKN